MHTSQEGRAFNTKDMKKIITSITVILFMVVLLAISSIQHSLLEKSETLWGVLAMLELTMGVFLMMVFSNTTSKYAYLGQLAGIMLGMIPFTSLVIGM